MGGAISESPSVTGMGLAGSLASTCLGFRQEMGTPLKGRQFTGEKSVGGKHSGSRTIDGCHQGRRVIAQNSHSLS